MELTNETAAHLVNEAIPTLRDEFFARLDGLTALAGRGLLQRVSRRAVT